MHYPIDKGEATWQGVPWESIELQYESKREYKGERNESNIKFSCFDVERNSENLCETDRLGL